MIASARNIKFLIFGLLFIAFVVGFYIFENSNKNGINADRIVNVGGREFSVIVANEAHERALGLGDVEFLPKDSGMLFEFDAEDKHCFWMKNVEYPIDILWFSKELELVHIERSVLPKSYPKSFCPVQPAMYVLEISDGASRGLAEPIRLTL